MSGVRVSVVMPALNEELNLERAAANVLQSFRAYGVAGELLIVNDGSSDATAAIAERLSMEHGEIGVIHHPCPHGIGASFWKGVRACSGEVVVMLPGDGENDAAEILRYLPLMNEVDIVVPFVFNREARSAARRLLSIVYREIIKLSFGLALNYMNGTVMYRTAILADIDLKNGGFFYQTELLVKTIRRGYLYAEVPCALGRRQGGDSSATTLRSLVRVAKGYLNTLKEVCLSPQTPAPLAETSVSAARRAALEAGRS